MQLEIHILQSFPPANLNRDENGMPKSTVFGDYRRARISSQCQKRAVRLYYHQNAAINKAHFAQRSRSWMPKLAELLQKDMSAEDATSASQFALEFLGAKYSTGSKKSEPILFLGMTELEAIADILSKNLNAIKAYLEEEKKNKGKRKKAKSIPKALTNPIEAALKPPGVPGDIALFGRMMASLPTVNVDAAVQMAHAISVNRLQQEFDFFTAVDDLGSGEDTGADHIGETGYNSSTYYRFTTLDTEQLKENLGSDEHLGDVIKAFSEAFVHAIPTGHQNGFAAHSLPAVVMAVVRQGQPVSLVDAFETPIRPQGKQGLLESSAKALDSHWNELSEMYGEESVKYKGIVTFTKLSEALNFLKESKKDSVKVLLDEAIAAALSNRGS